MKQTVLSEILTTRLSHDLIGNIGAVANAVELLNEGDDDDKEDICNILNFSSNVLSKRLKFFRLCFGLSNTTVKSVEELKEITTNYLTTLGNPNTPIYFDMAIETPKIYKLVMPAVMMMADVLIKGGKISVKQTAHSLLIIPESSALLNGAKLANISKILKNEEPEENQSAYAPLYYLLAYLDESGVNVKLNGETLVIGE
ncbi:MAG: hypothetical protein NC218_08980 [Acetobacter sp.]|nr:hypothetical protein [Acetobacter sp.]